MKRRDETKKDCSVMQSIVLPTLMIVFMFLFLYFLIWSIEIPEIKRVKQNATTTSVSYLPQEKIILKEKSQIEDYLKNNQTEILGEVLGEEIRFEYLDTMISDTEKIHTLKQYYKDTEIQNAVLNFYVSIEDDSLISIVGSYIEPINFEVQPEITESTAYETVLEKLKDEYKSNGDTIPEISKLGKKIIALKDKYIMLVYEFKYSETKIVVDAITGEIVNY